MSRAGSGRGDPHVSKLRSFSSLVKSTLLRVELSDNFSSTSSASPRSFATNPIASASMSSSAGDRVLPAELRGQVSPLGVLFPGVAAGTEEEDEDDDEEDEDDDEEDFDDEDPKAAAPLVI